MEIELKDLNGIKILTADGNLVGSNNNVLNEELQKITTKESALVVMNLKEVAQLDSYALGILASSGSEIQQKGGDLKFCELQPFVTTLFNMMRMNDIFEVFESEAEAVKSYQVEKA